MARTTSIKVTGNVTEAIAALEHLGIKAEQTAQHVESKLGGAAQRTGGLFSKLGGVAQSFGLPFAEVFDKIGEKFSETEVEGHKWSEGLKAVGQAAVLGLGAGAVAVGSIGIEAAQAAQKVEAQLRTAVENAGTSFDEFEPKMRAADSTLRRFGFTNNDTNAALSTLTTALGSPEKALGALQTAADLARSKNMDLNQASLLVAKAMEGQTRPLKQLGIDLPVYAGGAQNVKLAQLSLAKAQDSLNALLKKSPDAINPASKAHAAYERQLGNVRLAQQKLHDVQSSGSTILTTLQGKVKGSADAYGKTFAGQVSQAKAQLDNLAEQIGTKLMPILTKMMSVVESVVSWLGHHKDIAYALAAVVGGVLVAAIGAWTVSLFAAGGALAFLMSPITLIVAGIALLGFAIFELVKHWSTVWGEIKHIAADVWHFLDGVWHGIEHTISSVWGSIEGFFRRWWPEILGVFTGGIGLIVGLVIQHWHQIVQFTQQLWSDVTGWISHLWRDVTNAVSHGVSDVLKFFTDLPGNVMKAVGGLLGDMSKFGSDIVHSIIQGIEDVAGDLGNAVTSLLSHLPGAGALSHLPGIGGLFKGPKAAGGPVAAGSMYLVGEQGPEFFMPDRSGTIIPAPQTAAMMNHGTPSGAFGGAGGTTQIVNITTQSTSTAADIARETAWAIRGLGV